MLLLLPVRGAARLMYVSVDANTPDFLCVNRRKVILAKFCEVCEIKGSDFVVCLKFKGGLGFDSGDEIASGANAACVEPSHI